MTSSTTSWLTGCTLVAVLIVAGCTSGSDGGATATTTVTTPATTVTTPAAPSTPATSGPTPSPTPTPTTTTTPPSGTGRPPTASGGTDGGVGLCTPTVLTFAFGAAQGAAGTTYVPVVVTNASEQPCVTTGYPGVALVDAAGRQVLQASRDTTSPVATITLAPGQRATALIAAASAAANDSHCATYPALLFTMPDNTDSTKLVRSVFACAVTVRPFVAGDTGT